MSFEPTTSRKKFSRLRAVYISISPAYSDLSLLWMLNYKCIAYNSPLRPLAQHHLLKVEHHKQNLWPNKVKYHFEKDNQQ